MQEIYAALLLHSNKQDITVENLTKVLQAAGVKPEEGKLKALVASLEGKNIDDLIKEGVVVTPEKPVEKKEEKKEEGEEGKAEEAAAGLSLLFSA